MNQRLEQPSVDELSKTLLEQRVIFDNVTVGILLSRNRSVMACNALCAEILGYSTQELTGLAGIQLYPSRQAYQALAHKAGPVLAAGQPFHDEIIYKRKDGSTFWARTSAKAIDPLHPEKGTIWILADITAERAVRSKLEQTTHALQAIFDTAFIGIAVLQNQRILHCNPCYAHILGYEVDELIGQTTQPIHLSQSDYEATCSAFRAAVHSGQNYQQEQPLCRKDGTQCWARISARPLDPAHPEAHSVWMIEDITDRKRAEARVHEALAEQELIFNNAAVGMMFVRNRTVSRCNHKFENIFGYAEGELIGNSTLLLYPTLRDYDEDGLDFQETLQRGETAIGERQLRRKDGSLVWVRVTGHRTDASKTGLDVIWIYEDVTERHRAQDALRRAHNELEQRVIDRTSELACTNTRLQAEVYERLQAEQRIWHIAHHDVLTGLPNRSLLLERLDQTLTKAIRSKQRAALMFLDLDRFKSVNDTLGHHVGDLLLKHVADRLRESVRAVDTVARLGGDEFVVILHEIQAVDDAQKVAEKILAALAAAVTLDDHTLYATPSIGISLYPDDGEDAFVLMKNADTAMYHAKERGRNTFQFFNPQMHAEAAHLFTLEQRLRQALAQDQFILHYQPLYDHTQGSICGVEALLRWNDPETGLQLPETFLALAEEIGLILPLGLWALREACRQSVIWQQAGYPALRMCVNLSARQFRQKDLIDTLHSILQETGMPPTLLELEMTESSLMHDTEETLSKLQQLTEMGITLAIDDFGTGYSSLAYLKKFAVSRLKIDRDFVRDLCHDPDDAAIVSTIVAMANHLGLHIMAEGVETDAQYQRLLGLGCRQFQGYLFAYPQAATEVTHLLRAP